MDTKQQEFNLRAALALIGIFIALLLLGALSGCGGLIAGQTYKDLSPEQIKAVKESGATLTGCLSVGGPPVGGRTSIIVIPRTAVARVRFTPDCQIQGADFYFPGADEKEGEKKLEDEAPKPAA